MYVLAYFAIGLLVMLYDYVNMTDDEMVALRVTFVSETAFLCFFVSFPLFAWPAIIIVKAMLILKCIFVWLRKVNQNRRNS